MDKKSALNLAWSVYASLQGARVEVELRDGRRIVGRVSLAERGDLHLADATVAAPGCAPPWPRLRSVCVLGSHVRYVHAVDSADMEQRLERWWAVVRPKPRRRQLPPPPPPPELLQPIRRTVVLKEPL
eukprot:TRINITY_DN13495_c0_g1_i1.p2 TRINITY_DN13495_c0_g1~~TRINITY_DN13495_c0_g1_i1.p2  ORF type:complete len:128 (+),score=39.48 TRINITY_DN13495_c0_g1_i1:30-413(+)